MRRRMRHFRRWRYRFRRRRCRFRRRFTRHRLFLWLFLHRRRLWRRRARANRKLWNWKRLGWRRLRASDPSGDDFLSPAIRARRCGLLHHANAVHFTPDSRRWNLRSWYFFLPMVRELSVVRDRSDVSSVAAAAAAHSSSLFSIQFHKQADATMVSPVVSFVVLSRAFVHGSVHGSVHARSFQSIFSCTRDRDRAIARASPFALVP